MGETSASRRFVDILTGSRFLIYVDRAITQYATVQIHEVNAMCSAVLKCMFLHIKCSRNGNKQLSYSVLKKIRSSFGKQKVFTERKYIPASTLVCRSRRGKQQL